MKISNKELENIRDGYFIELVKKKLEVYKLKN